MFGIKTVVVGNMPHTTLAAAITAIKQLDGNKIDHTDIIRVYEWAWLGDWVETIRTAYQFTQDSPEETAFLAPFPVRDIDGYESPVVAGAENPDHFFLDIFGVGAQWGKSEEFLTRENCAWIAAESLFRVADDEDMSLVYAVILTEETYAKANSRIMFRALQEQRNADFGPRFRPRVFVVKKDGSVETHKLQ